MNKNITNPCNELFTLFHVFSIFSSFLFFFLFIALDRILHQGQTCSACRYLSWLRRLAGRFCSKIRDFVLIFVERVVHHGIISVIININDWPIVSAHRAKTTRWPFVVVLLQRRRYCPRFFLYYERHRVGARLELQ